MAQIATARPSFPRPRSLEGSKRLSRGGNMCLFRPGGAGFARWCYWRKVAAAAKNAGTGRARCSGTSSVSPSEDGRCKSVATSLFPLASVRLLSSPKNVEFCDEHHIREDVERSRFTDMEVGTRGEAHKVTRFPEALRAGSASSTERGGNRRTRDNIGRSCRTGRTCRENYRAF